MKWSELKTWASDTVHRKDVNWDRIQLLAGEDITRRLMVRELDANAIVPVLTVEDGFFGTVMSGALPADFGRMQSCGVGKIRFDPCNVMDLGFVLGPRYAINGEKLLLQGGSGSVLLLYGKRVEPFADDDAESVILDRYPNVWLYGLCFHQAKSGQDFDGANEYGASFNTALEEANGFREYQVRGAGAPAIRSY